MAFQPKTRQAIALIDREYGEERILALVAEGKSQQKIADQINAEKGTNLTQYYLSKYLNRSDEATERYKGARLIAAQSLAGKLSDITDDVLEGKRDPQSVKTASDNIKWLCAKLDPSTYSDRATVDLNVTNLTDLHLASLREAMRVVSDQTVETQE